MDCQQRAAVVLLLLSSAVIVTTSDKTMNSSTSEGDEKVVRYNSSDIRSSLGILGNEADVEKTPDENLDEISEGNSKISKDVHKNVKKKKDKVGVDGESEMNSENVKYNVKERENNLLDDDDNELEKDSAESEDDDVYINEDEQLYSNFDPNFDATSDSEPYTDDPILSRTKRMKVNKKKRKPLGGQNYAGNDFNRLGKRAGLYSSEYSIKRKLMRGYDKTTRPVRNDTSTSKVMLGMSLYHILDTNEKFQTLSALIAVRVRWRDEYLVWNPDDYESVSQIWVPANEIWRPDIFINNFADDSFQDFMNTFAIIQSNGDVLWMFPAVAKTYCTLDVRHFPFDRQKCNIIFISWTFNGFKLNITSEPNVNDENSVYYTPKNQEWYVDHISVIRNEKIYACCPEPYPDVTFTIHMTRRSLFYIINLIFPCLLIYAVSFLGFFLPVESGEKVNLEITILLALVVFLLIVGETLPPTPDAIPVLGVLFGTTMLMVSIALVMAVIVTNIFLRKDSGKRVPVCLRKCFIKRKARRNSLSNKVTYTENHVHETKLHDMDIDNVSVHSDLDTLTCRSSCTGRKRSSHNYRNSGPPLPIPQDLDLAIKISDEWQALAKCVDRLFFWLFLFSSIGALVSMFAQIPAYNAT